MAAAKRRTLRKKVPRRVSSTSTAEEDGTQVEQRQSAARGQRPPKRPTQAANLALAAKYQAAMREFSEATIKVRLLAATEGGCRSA